MTATSVEIGRAVAGELPRIILHNADNAGGTVSQANLLTVPNSFYTLRGNGVYEGAFKAKGARRVSARDPPIPLKIAARTTFGAGRRNNSEAEAASLAEQIACKRQFW